MIKWLGKRYFKELGYVWEKYLKMIIELILIKVFIDELKIMNIMYICWMTKNVLKRIRISAYNLTN